MKAYMLGRKAGMTQLFNEDGKAVPVTVIECGPIKVVQKKSEEVDGYTAVKFGFLEANVHQVNKPDKGQFDKIESEPLKLLAECPMESTDELELGQVISVSDNMNLGMLVDVSGVSKGKGFAGNIKRHGQKGGKEAHGSKYHRRVGSLGASAYPARVRKGKKMPGHMGARNVTVQNLEVVLVDGERNILAVKGAVPGPRGGWLEIRAAVKGGKQA